MNKELQNILSRYAEQQLCLDSIVVSSFIKNNALTVCGGLLADYCRNDVPTVGIVSIEDVINVFELAIPKTEKTKNGAVYTPKYIRDSGESCRYTEKPIKRLSFHRYCLRLRLILVFACQLSAHPLRTVVS